MNAAVQAVGARPTSRRWPRLLGAVVLAMGVLVGCGEAEPGISSCKPNYIPYSRYGNFSAQQPYNGATIAWGAYPSPAYEGTRYVADTYVGSTRIEHKDQFYAPHGSVPSSKVSGKAGQTFLLRGDVFRVGVLILHYELRCRIA